MQQRIDFADASLAVRGDILEAHQSYWRRLAAPGTWWTGRERVAIARESRVARRCALCAARREAVSPDAVEGSHDTAPESEALLPAAAIEAIHRIATDAGRMTRSFVERLAADGLADTHYVELLGIVVAVTGIDAFCLGLGASLHPLPEPEPGPPSRVRPTAAQRDVAWVPMLPPGGAKGSESDLWGPRPGNVVRAMSLVPEAVRDLKRLSAAHYLSDDRFSDLEAGRALSRPQMELLAGRVSALNECFY